MNNVQTKHVSAKLPSITHPINLVYLWMVVALSLSAMAAYVINNHPYLSAALRENAYVSYGIIILQLASVIIIARNFRKLSYRALLSVYVFYSLLTGICFGLILINYSQQDISFSFMATATTFLAFGFFGYVTKHNLSAWGSFLIMGLIGLIIVNVLTPFVPTLQVTLSQQVMGSIGVIIFSGLTAYNTQKIKQQFLANLKDENKNKMVLRAALTLYLDVINLFLIFIRLGRR